MLNDSIRYLDGRLFCDAVPVSEIATQVGTPVYIYSLPRALSNLRRIQAAFPRAHLHYSTKANANLALLKALVDAGAGIDAVSAGEIHRALLAGAKPADIVFAGVGKTRDELAYALEQQVGWINVENELELNHINTLVESSGHEPAQIALRLNPDIAANTHRYIATGHGGAKFGLSIQTVRDILAQQERYPHIHFAGIHIHIGSQLHDTEATRRAVETLLDIIKPYPSIRTVNIGGGLPVAYRESEIIPSWESFAAVLLPLLDGYEVMLEPGRSIIADAGILVAEVLYLKEHGGQHIVISDASMAELIRPALYEAHHEIVPLQQTGEATTPTQVVGPVCETADAIGHDIPLPTLQPGDLIAVLTAGAYGMVMASNYNQRTRPPEVVVEADGQSWRVARKRETWDDLLRHEQ